MLCKNILSQDGRSTRILRLKLGRDLDNRMSTSGHVYLVGGGAVSWYSKRQSTVATSTAEAEYIALYHATREAIWLRKLMADISGVRLSPVAVYADNQASIAVANNNTSSSRTKHIDIKYHFTREAIIDNNIRLVHCRTEDNVADIHTKLLPNDRFISLAHNMSLGY